MHPSIRYRINQKAPGIAESPTSTPKGIFQPLALKDWTYVAPNQPWRDDKALGIGPEAEKWDGYGKWMVKRKDGSVTYIAEEKIERGTEDVELLQAWLGVAAMVLD